MAASSSSSNSINNYNNNNNNLNNNNNNINNYNNSINNNINNYNNSINNNNNNSSSSSINNYNNINIINNNNNDHHRRLALELFDNSKVGIKAIARKTEVPEFFLEPETVNYVPVSHDFTRIPEINMGAPRNVLIDKIREASVTCGVFQLKNHGIPDDLCDSLLKAMRAFYNLPKADKQYWYGRHRNYETGTHFHTNHDLFHSSTACWRDTLQIRLGPQPNSNSPEVCRTQVLNWISSTYGSWIHDNIKQ